ncbi:putative MO25-like protein [Tanacetum coccineum]
MAVVELHPSREQILTVCGKTFLFINIGFHVADGVRAFNFKGNCLPGVGILDEYLLHLQKQKHLLGDMLLDRSNSAVMTRYASSRDNLRILMNLESSKSIQIEAFHVFKLFAANQNKPAGIVSILVANRSKLLRLFADFKPDKFTSSSASVWVRLNLPGFALNVVWFCLVCRDSVVCLNPLSESLCLCDFVLCTCLIPLVHLYICVILCSAPDLSAAVYRLLLSLLLFDKLSMFTAANLSGQLIETAGLLGVVATCQESVGGRTRYLMHVHSWKLPAHTLVNSSANCSLLLLTSYMRIPSTYQSISIPVDEYVFKFLENVFYLNTFDVALRGSALRESFYCNSDIQLWDPVHTGLWDRSEAKCNSGLNDIYQSDGFSKKMHFLLSSMSVVYMLTTPMHEDSGDNTTVEQVKKKAKWDNDDYVCRGLILNDMSDSLLDIYQNVESSKEL